VINAPVYDKIIIKSFVSGSNSGWRVAFVNSVAIIKTGNKTGNDKIGSKEDLPLAFDINADRSVVPLDIAIPEISKLKKKIR
jgi:hypothetical protein